MKKRPKMYCNEKTTDLFAGSSVSNKYNIVYRYINSNKLLTLICIVVKKKSGESPTHNVPTIKGENIKLSRKFKSINIEMY